NSIKKIVENLKNKYIHEKNRQMILTQSFWQLQKAIMTQVKQTAVDNDLSVPQFTILLMMQQKGQMPQKKLQARTHFPKSTLRHAIDGLVQDGILKINPSSCDCLLHAYVLRFHPVQCH